MSDDGNDPVYFEDVVVVHETDGAILVRNDSEEGWGGENPIWIPKSVIHDNSEVWNAKHMEGTLAVKAWFAAKEGMI